MNKLSFFLLPLLLAANLVGAQSTRPPGDNGARQENALPNKPEQRETRFARIRAAREAFLTEQLALTAKEAAAFFPVYWGFDKEMRDARRVAFRGHKDPAKNNDLTEAEAREFLLKDRAFRQKMLTLRSQVEDKLLKILPATRVVRIPEIEKAFRKKLSEYTRKGGG